MPRKARISIVPPSHGAPHHLHLHPQIQASILILRSIYCTCPSAYQDYSAVHVRTLCCQISDPHFYTHTHTHPHICTYMHTMVSQNLPPILQSSPPQGWPVPKAKIVVIPSLYRWSRIRTKPNRKGKIYLRTPFPPSSPGLWLPSTLIQLPGRQEALTVLNPETFGSVPLLCTTLSLWFLHVVLARGSPSSLCAIPLPLVSLSLLHTIHICSPATVMLKIESDYRNHTVAAWRGTSLFICVDLSGNICFTVGNNSNGHLFSGDVLAIWDRPLETWI